MDREVMSFTMGHMSLRRWVPWTLLSGLALLALGAVLTSVSVQPRTAPVPPSTLLRLSVPYDHVRWTSLHYPGLHCRYLSDKTANVGATGRLVLEQLGELRVVGQPAPLAVVVVGCNLSADFANLFTFAPGPDPTQPLLVQALGHYQQTEELLSLSTATNHIDMKVAGYTPSEAICCPGVVSVRRWAWSDGRFEALRPIAVTRIVMPNIVGLTDEQAERVLLTSGIASVGENAPDGGVHSNGQSRVVAQAPPVGTVIHPPSIQVTVTVR
jgi:hypothetical protein